MIKKIKIIFIMFIPFFFVSCGTNIKEYQIKIINVHDGDTFTDINNNKYRLFAIDTPEISDQYNDFKPTKGIEWMYAYESMLFVKNLILKKNVKIKIESYDKYNRKVARININNLDLGCQLVKEGFARVSYISINPNSIYKTNDYDYYKKILRLQRYAEKNKKGFWLHENIFSTIFPKSI